MTQAKKLAASIATAALLFGAPVAFAQTTTGTGTTGTTGVTSTTSTTNTTSTPGAPNTGAGGDAATNMLLLGVSGLVVVAGGAYLARRAAVR